MSAVTAALDTEIAEIEADIRDNPLVDPRQKRLDHLRSVREMYLAGVAVPPSLLAAARSDASGPAVMRMRYKTSSAAVPLFNLPRQGGRKPSPDRQRALKAAHEVLHDRTEPVKTSMILAQLRARNITIMSRGVPVEGFVAVNVLSAMLNNDPRFRSHGRAGWTLVNKEAAA